jgi:hypothetical protein
MLSCGISPIAMPWLGEAGVSAPRLATHKNGLFHPSSPVSRSAVMKFEAVHS